MKDLRSMMKGQDKAPPASQARHPSAEGNKESDADNQGAGADLKEKTMKTINNYSGMSESQLMSELMGAVAKKRGEGNFDESELDSFAERAAAFLTPEQAERMKGIISGLKK